MIGVNVSLFQPAPEKNNILRTMERTFNLMSNSNALIDKAYCDILIEAKGIEKYSMFDLQNQLKIMEAGYHHAVVAMSKDESWKIVKKCHRHYALAKIVRENIQRIKNQLLP